MGSSPKGLRTFAVLARESTPTIWRGVLASRDDVIIFPKDGELEALSTPGFDVMTLSYTEELLLDVVDTLGVGGPTDIIRGPEVASCDPGKLLQLRSTVSQVLKELMTKAPRMNEYQLLYEIEYEIPRSLILAMTGHGSGSEKPSPRSRYRAIRLVKEYIENFTYDNITVRDLCNAAGVSERTLRYAFAEHLGVSPKTFLKMVRLNRVRRDLRRSHPDDKNISDVANGWGFWHMGQFAKDYRALFAELPSDTRRQL